MKAVIILLLLCGCAHQPTPEPEPIYSVVPPRVDIVDSEEHEVNLKFRYLQDKMPELTDTVSNGWHVITGLPEIVNYETVSNIWAYKGIESSYVSNVIYYRQR